MKFDYYVLNSYVPEMDGDALQLYARWTEQVTLAEELGFHGAWFTEHHFRAFGGMLPSPQLLIAALAQRTSRIRLGIAVVILPFYNPVHVAEETAMLDVLTDGRLDVGVGRGMGSQYYDVFGVDPTTAQEKLEEQVDLLRTAWTGEAFSWSGKHYQCPNPITLFPKPVQQPHPPLWMPVSGTPAHGRWVGQQGFNLMTLPWNHPDFSIPRAVIDEYRCGLREAGHADDGRQVMGYFPAYVGETAQRACDEAEDSWNRWRRISAEQRGGTEREPMTYDLAVETGRVIMGDPEMCCHHLERVQAGASPRVDAAVRPRGSSTFRQGGRPDPSANLL
jgi:alkanesulfonate monooxygenase SsuD/methylene tetrahydromethanopterin reductase-like flavin-dependent oxidoreductase (luciferase family)